MKTGEKILIVEDDESILLGLELNLRVEGYEVERAVDGEAAIERLKAGRPHLVLLDVMLPRMNGFEVLAWIRARDAELPIVMLTAKDSEADIVAGLNLGADDYLVKPFALPELLARINAALRRVRAGRGNRDQIGFGDVTIDLVAQRVERAGAPVSLTATEYDLLTYLATSPGRVLTRDQILTKVWGGSYEGTARTVDNFIGRLRGKLEVDPDHPRHFVTVRGFGYRFEP